MNERYIIKQIMKSVDKPSRIATLKRCEKCLNKRWFYDDETLLICNRCRGN